MSVKYTSEHPCPVRVGDWPIKQGEVIEGPEALMEALLKLPGFEPSEKPSHEGVEHQGLTIWMPSEAVMTEPPANKE